MKYNLCSLNSNELFCAISISLLDTAHLEKRGGTMGHDTRVIKYQPTPYEIITIINHLFQGEYDCSLNFYESIQGTENGKPLHM